MEGMRGQLIVLHHQNKNIKDTLMEYKILFSSLYGKILIGIFLSIAIALGIMRPILIGAYKPIFSSVFLLISLLLTSYLFNRTLLEIGVKNDKLLLRIWHKYIPIPTESLVYVRTLASARGMYMLLLVFKFNQKNKYFFLVWNPAIKRHRQAIDEALSELEKICPVKRFPLFPGRIFRDMEETPNPPLWGKILGAIILLIFIVIICWIVLRMLFN